MLKQEVVEIETTHPSLDEQILRADKLSTQLEQLLFEKQTVRTDRDEFCLLYWSLVFEHHQGIMLLLHKKLYAPAFALIRPIVEAFLRLYVAVKGTEDQLAALKNGTYRPEFQKVGEQIDRDHGLKPLLGPWFERNTDILHGFTHGGLEQVMRRRSGADIIPNYSDEEVLSVVHLTTIFACLTAALATRFLGFTAENANADSVYTDYVQSF